MILAAGRGKRMGALTDHLPKPLLKVGNHHLIEYVIANVKRAGITEIVINLFYLGEQIKAALGNGERYGVEIAYSEEKEKLEVGGGIIQALPLLSETFVVVSADVITDYPLVNLPKDPVGLAHLIVVDNPPFHSHGDFGLQDGRIDLLASPRFNYANVGVYRKDLFQNLPLQYASWGDVVLPAIKKNEVTGAYYQGLWHNIGTPEDLRNFSMGVS
jgi:MurNAc alpha-1-phosphate uridylyltransferase